MFRWLALIVLLCGGAFVAVRYVAEQNPADAEDQSQSRRVARAENGGKLEPHRVERESPTLTVVRMGKASGQARANPVVIPGAQLEVIDKQDAASEREGNLLFIGTEVGPGEAVSPDRVFATAIGVLAIDVTQTEPQLPADQQLRFQDDPRIFRKWKEGDKRDPYKVLIYPQVRRYRRLEAGEEVRAGQIIAVVDPTIAVNDAAIKVAALESAESDRKASRATKEEAERRVSAMDKIRGRAVGTVSEDDYQGAILSAKRYYQEEIAKQSAVQKSQVELVQANTIVNKHEIRAAISGKIKVVYKNRGDSVKPGDVVMQIQSPARLRVAGLVDVQDAQRMQRGTPLIVEPTQPISPTKILDGHLGEVTAVAVTKEARPTIVSGSEDRTVRGWDAVTGEPLWYMTQTAGVRAVACTGPKARRNLALVGCADGSARILDLDNLDKIAPRDLPGGHRGKAVNCVAFSPDGSICATGGEDRLICIWNTESGERLYDLVQHRAAVTSLQFTANQLISAGRDNLLLAWPIEAGKLPTNPIEFDRRGGDVTRLGATADGKFVLFDQGKQIRMLSLATRQVEGVLQNASGAGNFTTMALFDPDGLTVLTNGASEGRLQLWRTPTHESFRGAELRQLIWSTGAVTCGSFSPDGAFCVTGTQDKKVLIWAMPERKREGKVELVETPVMAKITQVENFIDSANRQVRIWADLDNKDNRLVPGGTATMVVLPEGK